MHTCTMATIMMAVSLTVIGCGGSADLPTSATQPEEAVTIPVQALINNDIAAFLKFVAPAEDYAEMQQNWSQAAGDMDPAAKGMINGIIGNLDNPDTIENTIMPMVEAHLSEIDPEESAAGIQMMGGFMLMGLTGADPQAAEQAKEMLDALAEHIRTCGINDVDKARTAINTIANAITKAGISSVDDIASLPFESAMKKLSPVFGAIKEAANVYGFDINGVLRSIKVTASGEGDSRDLSVSGTILGKPFTVPATVVKVGGQWQIDDGDDSEGFDDDFDFDDED